VRGAMVAPERFLDDVLDLVGRDVAEHPPREALELGAVATIDRVPRAALTGARRSISAASPGLLNDRAPRRDPTARTAVEAHQRPLEAVRGAEHAECLRPVQIGDHEPARRVPDRDLVDADPLLPGRRGRRCGAPAIEASSAPLPARRRITTA
jgi:hypothetical protein